jgi:hypothetical protein
VKEFLLLGEDGIEEGLVGSAKTTLVLDKLLLLKAAFRK